MKTCRCGTKMVAQANSLWTCPHCDEPCRRNGKTLQCPFCVKQLKTPAP